MNNRVPVIIKRLKKTYPGARIALRHRTPMELLAATILSAQCTDERVNKITETLFQHYRSVGDFADADLRALEKEIRSSGFYHAKARNIIGAAKRIRDVFHGRVPDSMEQILTLPGVARKTGNVVLSNAYGVIAGIVVDTHVRRVTQRLGLTKNDNPEKIERDLMAIVPKAEWPSFPYYIQTLGRAVCKARKPHHAECVLLDICPSSNIVF